MLMASGVIIDPGTTDGHLGLRTAPVHASVDFLLAAAAAERVNG